MKLSEMLQSIPVQAKAIRESLGFDSIERVGADFKANEGIEGSRPIIARNGAAYTRRVMECAKLIAEVSKGTRPMWHLREAMTVSDFPNLFGDLLYRQLLGNYQAYPTTYQRWCRVVDVNDFRKLHLYAIDGGQGLLGPGGTSLQAIKEREPYPEVAFQESPFSVQVLKYGRRYGISFEMIINDDLNAFNQRPMMMAVGARRSEEYLATTLLCDANGPNANFFSAQGGAGLSSSIPVVNGVCNKVLNNPSLSIQGLQTAMTLLAAQKDLDGQPIVIDAVELIVPPALEITAQNILHATDIRINSNTGSPAGASPGGATIDQYIHAQNWMRGRVTLSVNSYIPIVATATKNGVNVGNSSWFLIANPNNQAGRPAFVFAFMRGRRQPQLFIKDPDQRMLGGGESDPMEGNFGTDAVDYKMRHIFGASTVDPRMVVGSDGSEAA